MTPLPARRPSPLSLANLALVVATPLATRLHAVARHRAKPEGRRARHASGPATPPPVAFAIWAPLFAINITHAALRATQDKRRDPAFKRLGWLTSATYALNIAWSVNAQLSSLGWRSVMLIGASTATSIAAAHVAQRYERWGRGGGGRSSRLTSAAMAPLAGWLTVATFSNVEAALNTTQGRPDRRAEARRAVGLVAAASGVASAATYSMRGNSLYAAAAGVGLAGVLVKNRKRPAVASAAAAGLVLVGAAVVLGRRRPALK